MKKFTSKTINSRYSVRTCTQFITRVETYVLEKLNKRTSAAGIRYILRTFVRYVCVWGVFVFLLFIDGIGNGDGEGKRASSTPYTYNPKAIPLPKAILPLPPHKNREPFVSCLYIHNVLLARV